MRTGKIKLSYILGTVIVAIALVGLVVLYYKVPVAMGGSIPEMKDPLPSDTMLSADAVKADREYLIDFVESVHPYFVDGSDIDKYNEAKDRYISQTSGEMPVYEFGAATGEYLAFFEDGHTELFWWAQDESFEIWHSYHDGQMYYFGEDGNGDTGLYITAIDDTDMVEIYDVIDTCFSSENEMGRTINYDYYFNSENVLKYSGVDTSDGSLTVTLSDGSQVECTYLQWEEPEDNDSDENNFYGNSMYIDGDVVYIKFVNCREDEGYKAVLREVKKALLNGYTKFIIDVRGNGGGNSGTCDNLLEALGMKAPKYGTLTRYSEEAKEELGYLRKNGSNVYVQKLNGKNNPKISLAVLCDRYTFSSATMMCAYVHDGELGVLIGESSSNKPSMYGHPISFNLENSHIYGRVSHKRFTRPNGETEEDELVPDIVVPVDRAYQTAIDYLNN